MQAAAKRAKVLLFIGRLYDIQRLLKKESHETYAREQREQERAHDQQRKHGVEGAVFPRPHTPQVQNEKR
jgi:hypothetical protein